jgi:hypothetical protein
MGSKLADELTALAGRIDEITGLDEGIMGKPSMLAPPPGYLEIQNALAQQGQALAQSQAQASQAAQQHVSGGLGNMGFGAGSAFGQTFNPGVSVSGMETKVLRKIHEAIDQLPLSICTHISTIAFRYADEAKPRRFDVVFDNARVISFPDVDNFPAAEDIARIALECP